MTADPPATPPPPPRYAGCSICAGLGDYERGSQKYGWPENDVSLPPATGRLTIVREYTPRGSRELLLQQCPECQTCYLYRSDYEYFAPGTEDEQYLVRLSDAEAPRYLSEPAGDCIRLALDTKFNLGR